MSRELPQRLSGSREGCGDLPQHGFVVMPQLARAYTSSFSAGPVAIAVGERQQTNSRRVPGNPAILAVPPRGAGLANRCVTLTDLEPVPGEELWDTQAMSADFLCLGIDIQQLGGPDRVGVKTNRASLLP